MDPDNEKELNRLIDETTRELLRIAVEEAFIAYVLGVQDAYYETGTRPDMRIVNQQAVEYSKLYEKELVENGGTYMNGQFRPWVTDMKESMRRDIYLEIEKGITQGKYPGARSSKSGTYPKDSIAYSLQKTFNSYKGQASTIARTETKRIQNQGLLNQYKEFGFDLVWVHDGQGHDPCEICKALNGQVWTLEYARTHELEHPNCVRTFSAYRGDKPPDQK